MSQNNQKTKLSKRTLVCHRCKGIIHSVVYRDKIGSRKKSFCGICIKFFIVDWFKKYGSDISKDSQKIEKYIDNWFEKVILCRE